MCYLYGSTDPASAFCPMCKVFKPSGNRCPHIRDVCYNRALHPRHDIVHLKNAEVKSFNGCGYCKWARANPSSKVSLHQNPGWPGCCRPPSLNEQRLIQAADWPSVSIVHSIPMPQEIKSILESVRGAILPGVSPTNRSPAAQQQMPSLDRRNSGSSPTTRSSPTSGKNQAMPIPTRGRSGGSPVQQSSPLTGTTPRASGPLSSFPNSAEQSTSPRRQTVSEGVEKTNRTPSMRRATDLDGSLSRRNGGGRPSLSSVSASLNSSKPSAEYCPPAPYPSPVDGVPTNSPDSPFSSRRSTLEGAMAALKVGSTAGNSSDSGSSQGSVSDATVISDGGFTDYLSDESEAELQRQAEAKAALVAQNQAEEQEFKAARQQLAGVGLRPPKSWDDTNDAIPRTMQNAGNHAVGYAHHPAYASPVFVPPAVTHSARG
ncbi:hypothetical protein DFJ58DRAFT_757637 [Suillus subalutaceus]|uniref:uncharacterized protein n=1 Tax=Suillus subalutaceus TaxID=48586 RepID=UPI001B87541D|nr:uncharacterized protein DFJ58DRAFT_757637 [Suillus subalutaceus]KAG1874555.1 hypothetical protein DFJ58DRAFT_757637 [Suillus subalutaceus]